MEEELDFNEEQPFDLSEYDQYFEWDEVEYMRLQFIAAQHYASRRHWDDAYAYVLRSQPGTVSQHEDTYNRNAQAWHYTCARIREILEQVEQILAAEDAQWTRGISYPP